MSLAQSLIRVITEALPMAKKTNKVPKEANKKETTKKKVFVTLKEADLVPVVGGAPSDEHCCMMD